MAGGRLTSGQIEATREKFGYTTPKLKEFVSLTGRVIDKYPFLRIRLDDFKMLRPLGRGGYGQVFLAEHIQTEELFALKIVDMREFKDSEQIRILKHEIEIGTRPFGN